MFVIFIMKHLIAKQTGICDSFSISVAEEKFEILSRCGVHVHTTMSNSENYMAKDKIKIFLLL